jgi:hypothetical protein
MAKHLEEIYNICLDRIDRGESIESCLLDYPEIASELQILLRTSRNIRWRTHLVGPRPEFKRRARAEFVRTLANEGLNAHYEAMRKRYSKRPSFLGLQRAWAPALATLAMILILGSAGSVTATAAGNAMPDQPLYPVKLFTEEVRLTFSYSDTDKALANMRIAETRSEEIEAMASQGKTDQVILTTQKLMTSLENTDTAINRILQSQANVTMLATAPAAPQNDSGSMVLPPPASQPEEQPVTGAESKEPQHTDTPGTAAIDDSYRSTDTATASGKDKTHSDKTTSGNAKLKQSLQSSINRNIDVLEQALKNAPESARSAIERAIERTRSQQEKIAEELPNNGHDNLNNSPAQSKHGQEGQFSK